MRNTHSFKMNLPEMSDPVDVRELNDNFLVIDDALMAGLCKKELTTNNMGSSDPASRKYGWAPWLEIYNGNDFDVVVIDRNAPDLPSGTINIEAGKTHRMFINGTYYMNFYVQDQYDVTFKWFTNAETRINEIEPSGGGGVSSVNVTGASGSHIESSGGPVTDSGTIELSISTGYSIPSDNKQTAWDGKAVDIALSIDSSTYVMTAQLKDAEGTLIGTAKTIDLPLEEMVVDAEYDPQTQKIKLELKNGNYVEFSVAELVSGLQTELSSSNKLNPAYIDYDSSHRAVSDTEKDTWNAKQNAISDLGAIRSGAAAGATAVQPSALETALSAKQDTISDLAAIRSGASAGATAVQPETMSTALALKQDSLDNTQLAAVNSGINSTKVAQIETNKDNISLVEDANGTKNLFDYNSAIVLDDLIRTGSTFTATATDNRNFFAFHVMAYYNETYVSVLYDTEIRANGIISCTFTKDVTFNELTIKHSGQSNDIGIYFIDASNLINGETYVVSLNILQYNPENTLQFKDIMICKKSLYDISSNYEPYSLPNYELTKLESEDRAALVEAIDNGVKNLLPKLKSYTDSGLSMVINDDNSITAKWSATGSSTLYARINDNNWTLPRGTYVLSGMPNDNNIGCYIHIETNTSQLVVQQERKTPVKFTIDEDYEYLKIYISVRPNSAAETSGVTILPMIVSKAVSDVEADSYAPPALSNYQLTQEVNALHERADQIQPVVKFETDVSGWYRVFTLGSINSVAAVGAYDNSCDIIIKRLFANNNNEHHEIKLASLFESMKFIDERSKSNVLLINNIRYVSTSDSAYIDIYYSGSAMNTMVCSVNNNAGESPWKAVNTVSRVSETTTGETVWASYAFHDNYLSPNDPVYIDTGSLNDLTENKLYYVGTNITDKPTSDWGFVRNTKFDSNTGMQEFVSIGTSSDAYIRTKVSGTWQAWKQITNS